MKWMKTYDIKKKKKKLSIKTYDIKKIKIK